MRGSIIFLSSCLLVNLGCGDTEVDMPADSDAGVTVFDAQTLPDREVSFADSGVASFRDAGFRDTGTTQGSDAGASPDAGEAPIPTGYVRITAGTFSMGSPSSELGRESEEGPTHDVTLTRDYYLKATEVTQEEWNGVMAMNPSTTSTCGKCPVDGVSRSQAKVYMNALSSAENLQPCYDATGGFIGLDCTGYRLPTEAEWEYAARAGTSSAFFDGDITQMGCTPPDPILFEIGWFCGNLDPTTGARAVATRMSNPWGLYDMHGNALEWVHDRFGPYQNSSQTDPVGPLAGDLFIVRGGAFWQPAEQCRSASRRFYRGEQFPPGIGLGFRPARSLLP